MDMPDVTLGASPKTTGCVMDYAEFPAPLADSPSRNTESSGDIPLKNTTTF
jgi:hypothetical protein